MNIFDRIKKALGDQGFFNSLKGWNMNGKNIKYLYDGKGWGK